MRKYYVRLLEFIVCLKDLFKQKALNNTFSFIFMSSSKHLNIQIKGIFHQRFASFGIAAWFDIESRVIFVKVGHSQVLGLNVCSLLWYLFLFTYLCIFLIWPNKLEITCLKGQLTQKGICRHPSIILMLLKTSMTFHETQNETFLFLKISGFKKVTKAP